MRKNRIAVVVAAVLVGVGGWAVAQKGEKPMDLAAELMDADRAFAKATAADRLDGWMSVMADDAVRIAPLGGKAYIGKAAVKELDASLFADPNSRLVWEPTAGGAFADGKHGFTTGMSKMLVKAADGTETVKWTGAYVTWWRKDGGKWKVILDTGAATVAAPKP
jgi:ketosteroid isomerase-like protein